MSDQTSTKKPSVLVILRREYLEITGNHCAAKLIEYFKHWTKWKLKNQRTDWVYQPLKNIYADLMGEHSLHVIRRAIALLEEIGILEKRHNPGNGQDKTYQYRLKLDAIAQLVAPKFKNESSSVISEEPEFNVEQHHRSDPLDQPEFSYTQQHAVAEEEKKVTWEELVQETETWEQSQIAHFVEEPEQDCSTNDQDHHESELSGAGDEENLNLNKAEIAEVCSELRRLRINPQPCLGVIKKHWDNVSGAIARVKDAMQEGWCTNPTGLFINSCKSGTKGKNTVTADVSAWFDWARRQRLVLAMSGGVVYTPDGEAVGLQEMMQRYPYEQA